MIVVKYLVINNRGSMQVKERFPNMKANEVCLRLEVSVPDELFERPLLEATLKIPKEAIPKGKITTEVTDNVQRLIKEVTGLEMHVTVVEHEKAEGKNTR